MNDGKTGISVAVIVVAAGRGERSGHSLPKQYVRIAGTPVLQRTLRAFQKALPNALIQVVINDDDREVYTSMAANLPALPEPVVGGATRQQSVLAGLEAIKQSAPDIILIHDAARPFLSGKLIHRVLENVSADAGVVPTMPVTDTLRQSDDAVLGNTVSREGLRAMQTPQAFPFPAIYEAHILANQHGHTNLTDDAEVFQKAGYSVRSVPGERQNIKLTQPDDFEYTERIMAANSETRIGQGFDVHAFADGDSIRLCGISIPFSRSLKGHSDADVGLHALTDALLGAIADGDIGAHFPPSDPQWKGASSDLFVRDALARVGARQGRLLNIDVTLVCEQPKVGPYRDDMRAAIASLCKVDPDRVSVKATTSERLGFTGRGEGIAAIAVATISLPAAS